MTCTAYIVAGIFLSENVLHNYFQRQMSASIPNSLQVGNRIQIGSDRATIKYIGSVKGTKGEWLGIEWDDAQRGKHDGVHQGERYFNCG